MASLTLLPQVKSALLTTTGLLLSTAVLATGCGGSDTMRVTLTDEGCAYEGDTTPAPGQFDIEVENRTSHYAIFILTALAAGKNLEDVQHAFEQARPAFEQGKEPKPGTFAGLFGSGAADAKTGPYETKVMPVNESSGRFVIECWVHTSADALQSEQRGHFPPPAAVYVVPAELEVQ
jgi:hypothetical protein